VEMSDLQQPDNQTKKTTPHASVEGRSTLRQMQRNNVNFQEYQDRASRTSDPKLSPEDGLINAALGVAGEAGEIAELVKKYIFHGTPLELSEMASEVGDVLWYLAEVCSQLEIRLDDAAQENIFKLLERYPDGFQEGGGNR